MKYFPALLVMITISCTNRKADKPVTASADTASATLPQNANDTLVISQDAAVYYSPDSIQLAKWKKDLGEENFYIAVDDWAYYMTISKEYLTKSAIPVKDASGKKAIKFIKADNSTMVIGLDTLDSYWAAYLFTPAKDPEPADIVSMEESCIKYFSKKKD